MYDYNQIIAKKSGQFCVNLLDHTQHVVSAIELFSKKIDIDFDTQAARMGAVTHDLGKAHPEFQRKIRSESRIDPNMRFLHRHEISSLAFLPCFPKVMWDYIIDMVVAHHHSVRDAKSEKGILDLKGRSRTFIDDHIGDWEIWKHHGYEIINYFKYRFEDFNASTAKNAIEYVIDYCNSRPKGISHWRGLMNASDYFASAFTFKTKKHLSHLFETPDLSFYSGPERKSELFPLSLEDADDNRPHTLVVAPTGCGKTDFLMRRCKSRVFYTLPYQASINAMWNRFKDNEIPNKDIRMLHATSSLVVKKSNPKNPEESILQPFVGSAVKVLTPYQIAAIIFGTKAYESIILDLKGSDVILDEIHTYSDNSRAMVIEIVKTLININCRIHIGTATMPMGLFNVIKEILGGEDNVYEVILKEEQLNSFDRHRIYKHDNETDLFKILQKAIENKEKILLVFNTIKKAQDFYSQLVDEFPKVEKMLIHSRYRRKDRAELEQILTNEFNGDGNNPGHKPCLVVSTQVVEVSLDISFDRMITQAAPLDSLIQRFGRINRKRNPDRKILRPIHVLSPENRTLPYDKEIVEKSYAILPDNGEVLKQTEIQNMIDSVFTKPDIPNIKSYIIWRDGKCMLRELENNPKAILVELLDIDSINCILEQDRERYIEADFEERMELEIPMNFRSLRPFISQYEQLKEGNKPFVAPQDTEEYQMIGFKLKEKNQII